MKVIILDSDSTNLYYTNIANHYKFPINTKSKYMFLKCFFQTFYNSDPLSPYIPNIPISYLLKEYSSLEKTAKEDYHNCIDTSYILKFINNKGTLILKFYASFKFFSSYSVHPDFSYTFQKLCNTYPNIEEFYA